MSTMPIFLSQTPYNSKYSNNSTYSYIIFHFFNPSIQYTNSYVPTAVIIRVKTFFNMRLPSFSIPKLSDLQ